jgi:hypothetical protein
MLRVLTFQGRILGKASYLLPGHCSGCVVSRLAWCVDCSLMACSVRLRCSSMKWIRLLGRILEKENFEATVSNQSLGLHYGAKDPLR